MPTNSARPVEEGARLRFDSSEWASGVAREPLGFEHNLHRLDLFAFDSLRALAAKYDDRDHFIAASAPSPGTEFYAVPFGGSTPLDALERLDGSEVRILLKRPENYDPRFKALLATLFREAVELRGGLGRERIVRLESGIFLSSAAAVTPFHFDPEITFFCQIEGEKIYHVFSPSSVAESELERFYVKGIVNIGQARFDERDPAAERIFELRPGAGFRQPQNAPHWVETRRSRSISYAFSYETDGMRALNRTRSFNHYQRALGGRPSRPGTHPSLDALKARTMESVIPARKAVANLARTTFASRGR